MQKRLIAPLLLAMLVGGPVYAQIPSESLDYLEGRKDIKTDRDHNMKYFSRFTENYFETDLGMTRDDYSRYQAAEGLRREGKLDLALEMLDLLYKAYPDSVPVRYQMTKLYLTLNKPEQALDILEATIKGMSPLEDEDQPVLYELVMLEITAYQSMNQPAKALATLQNAPLKPQLLSAGKQEDYYLTLATLMLQTGRSEEAYHYLMAILETNQRASSTRDTLLKWSPGLAEDLYRLASDAYRQNNFIRSQHLALICYNLNPVPVKYTQLLARAQAQVLDLINEHFERALEPLKAAVSQMRYNLQQGDYQALYKVYLGLRDNKDVAFFLNHDYEGYLPASMQVVLREVEDDLKARGFKI